MSASAHLIFKKLGVCHLLKMKCLNKLNLRRLCGAAVTWISFSATRARPEHLRKFKAGR